MSAPGGTSSWAALRFRSFRWVWIGMLTSNVGTWMQTTVLGDYVARSTGTARWPAIIAACEFVPTALLGPVGGAFADRYSRKHMMLIGALVQGVLATLLTIIIATSSPGPGVIAMYAFANGVVFALAFPAMQAMLPDLVPAEHLTGAIGLSSAAWNLGRVVGPAVGAVLYRVFSITWVLGINAASFVAVVIALTTVHIPRRDHGPPARIRHAIAEAMRFVRTEPGLRLSAQMMSLNTLLLAPFIGLIPAMVVKVFEAPKSATGVLITAQGIGAVITGLALGSVTARIGVRRLMQGSLVALPLALIAYSLASRVLVAAIALVLVGMIYFGALSSFTTVAQMRAPERLRGRVLSVNNLILGVFYPVGLMIQGGLADRVGVREVTIGGAVVMLAVLALQRVVRPRSFDVLDEPVASAVA